MIGKILLTIILLMFAAPAYSEMGYSRDPWGSNTWTGPGRPPHWGPPQRQHGRPPGYRPPRPVHPIVPGHKAPIYIRPKPYPETYYEDNQAEEPRSTSTPVYHRNKTTRPQNSTVKCSGTTRTFINSAGQTVIEYVSSANDCNR